KVAEGLDHCRAEGFDRNGVRSYFDGLVQSAALARIKTAVKPPASKPEPENPEPENPEWTAVRDAVMDTDKTAKSWLASDVIRRVSINGSLVVFGISTRLMRDHVERVYGAKIATVWQAHNPKIAEFRYEVRP